MGKENTSITVHVDGQEEEIDTADILNQLELASDTIEQLLKDLHVTCGMPLVLIISFKQS